MPARAKKRNLFGFGSRTYSARTGEWRKSEKDKKAEARKRKEERAEAERDRKQERAEAKKERREEAAEKRRQAAEDRKERDLKHRMEMREKAEQRRAEARRRTAAKSSYPALFGVPYDKLSPSQQAIVRRASNIRKRNPGRSFADCVKAVSKQRGVKSPAAVCAASKMRTPAGKRELMAAAKAGRKNPGMCPMSGKNPFETLRQGKSKADIFQLGPHEFAAQVGSERKNFKTYSAAKSWARLRLHEVANPKGFRVRVVPYKPGKRNPFDAAQKLSEEFHGIPSTEVLEIREKEHYHSNLSGIGPLISLQVLNRAKTKEVTIMAPDPVEAPIEDVVFMTFTEDGRQIIFVGGDQGIDFKPLMNGFGLTEADVRDHMEIGEIACVTYRTKKIFEAGGEEEVDFYHELGGEGSKGVLPTLVYKRRNPSLEVVGGRYRIGKFDKGLGASPGIIG